MVDEAEKATAATQAAAREAKRQADLAEESYRRLERPYLFIEFASTGRLRDTLPGEVASLEYTFVNYGRTPAIIRSISVGVLNNPQPFPPISTMTAQDMFYDIVEPGGKLKKKRTAEVMDAQPGEQFSDSNATLLILHGIIEYDDATGAHHVDNILMRGNLGGTGFSIEDQAGYNYRRTQYSDGTRSETKA